MNRSSSISLVWLKNLLNQPYPMYYQGKFLWVLPIIVFTFTLCFNYFFEPFEVARSEHKLDFFWISVIHGLVPMIIIIILALIAASPHLEEYWTVKKELLLLGGLLLSIGITQFFIRDIIYDNPGNWSIKYFYEEIRNTFLIGGLFALIITSINFNILLSKNRQKANLLHFESTNKDSSRKVLIKTQVKKDDLTIDVNNFLFARSQGNYSELYLENYHPQKTLKRISLKELAEVFRPFDFILKTHRSYLVNLKKVNHVKGNAQGYQLKLDHCNETVPVARNLIKEFESKMTKS